MPSGLYAISRHWPGSGRTVKMPIAMILALLLLILGGLASSEGNLTPDIFPEPTGENIFGFGGQIGDPNVAVDAAYTPQPNAEQPWVYPISQDILDDPLDLLRLVNNEHLLDKSYPPDGSHYVLVDATAKKTSGAAIQARDIANDALELMFAAADADGVKLYLHTGYRSYSTQATMYENRIRTIGHDDGSVQKAGASDHQTGLGFDIISWSWRDARLSERFAETKEAQWMAANCARYGFILRYPQDKESVTGVQFEPWHLRFVGVDAAMYMTENGLTLEEFTVEWKSALSVYITESGQQQREGVQDSFSF